jgi:hypothetical protein
VQIASGISNHETYLQVMVKLFLVTVEMQWCSMRLVVLIAEEYIVGPVCLFHVDKVICQATEHEEENDSLGGEGGLKMSCVEPIPMCSLCALQAAEDTRNWQPRRISGSAMCAASATQSRAVLRLVIEVALQSCDACAMLEK